jgi:hypothetical protein
MSNQYRIVTYKLDTAGTRAANRTRYKVVVYDALTDRRVDYVYHQDPEKGLARIRKRLPYDAKITLEKGY